MSRYINLHVRNNRVLPVSTSLDYCQDYCQFLPDLLSKTSRVDLSHGFWIDLGVSSDTQVFVARENRDRDDPYCALDVYAIDLHGGKIRESEVFNTARSTFEHAFREADAENLTVYYYPNSRSADEEGYPCGTIFTIGPTDRLSNSSEGSNLHCSSRLLQPTYFQESSDFYLPSPTPAESNDQHKNCFTRKGEVQEEVVSVVQPGDLYKFAKTAGYTGTQPVILVTNDGLRDENNSIIGQSIPGIGIEGVSSPAKDAGVVMSPAEESSTSADSGPSKGQDRPPKLGYDAMVTGHMLRTDATLSVSQVPARRLSLQVNPVFNRPIPEGNILVPQGRTRAFSNLEAKTEYPRRSLSDPDSEHSFVPVKAEDRLSDNNLKHSIADGLAEPARPVLLRSTSGPPTTPIVDTQRPLHSKTAPPHGIERQGSHGENEIVVGIGKAVDPPNSELNFAVTASDTTQVKEIQGSLRELNLVGSGEVPAIQVNGDQEGLAEAVMPMALRNTDVCDSGMERLGVSGSEDLRSSTSGTSGSFSEQLSETDLHQVHLLGHACNQRCHSKMGCHYASDPSFAEGVKQMTSLVQSLRDGISNSDDLKRYIRIHCYRDCPGPGCRVPHLAAGCALPSVPRIASNHTPSPPVPLHGLEGASFDNTKAFDSTTPPDTPPETRQLAQPREQMKLPLDGQQQARVMHASATPTPNRVMPVPEKHFNGYESPMVSKRGVMTPYMEGRAWEMGHQFAKTPLCVDPQSQLLTPGTGAHWYPGGMQTPNYRENPLGAPQDVLDHHDSPIPGRAPLQQVPTPGQEPQTPNRHEYSWKTLHQGYQRRLYCQQNQPTPGGYANHQQATLEQGYHCLIPGRQLQGIQVSNEEAEMRRNYQFQKYDAARIRQLLLEQESKGRQDLPDVGEQGFPECKSYRGIQPWTVIYSATECQDVLMPGFIFPRPHMDREKLGKGGNGKVSRHYVNQRLFAIKETHYRQGELNAWRKLSHPNLVPLLGVMLGQTSQTCYQFMPYMSNNLSEVTHRVGCLEKLSKSESAAGWKVVKHNMWHHVLIPVLQGLQHLESLNMQHCDVKASNILISKPETCSCQDVLHCTCPNDIKFMVMLADYDSIKETEHRRVAHNIPHVECSCKSPDQLKKVMGTIAYRAPEKFMMPCKSPPPSSEATPKDNVTYLEGPWCDMWSFGMVVSRLALGRDTDADKRNANILKDQPHRKDLTTSNETTHAFIKLKSLYQAATSDINLKPFADVANACLEPDFRRRLTPCQLLDIMKGQGQT